MGERHERLDLSEAPIIGLRGTFTEQVFPSFIDTGPVPRFVSEYVGQAWVPLRTS